MLQKPADVLRVKADLQHRILNMLQIILILLQTKGWMLQVDLPAGPLNLAWGPGEDGVLQIDLDLLQVIPCGEPTLVVLLQMEDPLQPRKDVLLQILRAQRLRAQWESA